MEEESRTSLLDVVIDEYQNDRASRTSRLVVTAIIDDSTPSSSSSSVLQRYHFDFFEKMTTEFASQQIGGGGAGSGGGNNDSQLKLHKITGVLFIINNTTVAHVLEAPTHIIFHYLRSLSLLERYRKNDISSVSSSSPPAAKALKEMTNIAKSRLFIPAKELSNMPSIPISATTTGTGGGTGFQSLFKNAKICSFTEEVPREFPIWAMRSVRLASDEWITPKDLLKTVFDTVKNFLELGREVGNMSEEKALDYLTNNSSKQFLNRLPSAERIHAYTLIDDLCSIDEFLEIYDSPVELTLESERVWPVEPFLKY